MKGPVFQGILTRTRPDNLVPINRVMQGSGWAGLLLRKLIGLCYARPNVELIQNLFRAHGPLSS